MSNSNTPGNFPDSTPTRDTPSEFGETPAQLQTPLPNSAFQTPAFGDILSPGDRFAPLPNTIGSGRQYVVPPMRGHTSTSAQSSPLYYPGSQNAPVAPRVSNTSVAGPDTFEAEEIRTQRRNFHRGDINSTILSPGFEPMSPGVGLTPFTQGGVARSQDGATPFQVGASPSPFGSSEQGQTDSTQVIWGTTVNIHKAMSDFYKFLSSFSLDDLPEAMRDSNQMADSPYYTKLMEEMSQTQQLNLNLDCSHLMSFPETQSLYHQLKRYPQEIIPLMDHTLTTLYFERFGIQDHLTQPLRVRPFNLVESVNMRELNPSDIDQLVTVKGLLIRASHILPDLKSAFFKCYVCDHTVTVGIDRGVVAEPVVCPRPDCQSANSMQLIHNRSMFADKQVCKLQETPDSIPDGQTPHSVSLCLYDDLVDASKPGDRLEVTGIFRSVPIRVNPRMRTIKSLFRTYVDVVHIKTISASRAGGVSVEETSDPLQDPSQRLSPEQEDEIRALSTSTDIYQKLSHSLASSIFGLDDVKKGVLLQLFGGSSRTSKSSNQATRGDLHILLVGDPGTSKSQLLQYAHRIAPRGMYTSGKGSSAVGLTAYVTRDPDTNQLVLESGALVLSDGGLCCIDEFDKMSDSTRSILHEVMEQQTVSIAKAGIITTLNARTSILACANPVQSQWQRNLSVPENINLPPSLLSRFDLVYLMLDTANEDQDRRLARHLVSLYLNPNGRGTETNNAIPTHLLTRYIAYAKSRINPVLNDEASRELVRMYVDLRKAGESNRRQEARITATTRQLESLIRLSEAHARMRLSPVVEKSDVEEAFRLLREAIKESATDPRTGLIDWDILATGLGTHSRRQLSNIKMGLVELLGQPASSANILTTQLLTELNRRASSSGVSEVTYKDLEIILNELENEQLVTLSGNGRNNRKVRRNFHQGYVLPHQN